MSERLKDVPIVKCADRYKGGMFFLQNYEPSAISHQPIFILDDGFQHWRLYRDIDIVLIDGLNPFGSRKLLPMGLLREPLKELKRADIFVITKTPFCEGGIRGALSEELRGINPEAPVYFSGYRIHKVRDADGNEYPIEILKDKKVFAFCGIANPESFKQNVLSVSVNLCEFKAYRDHYRYCKSDANYIEKQGRALGCDFLITTEKDMVKLKELKIPSNILYIEIGFDINKGFFERLFKKIQDNYHQGGEYG
jgi:tetraacyldisaccharide 4'-kinase